MTSALPLRLPARQVPMWAWPLALPSLAWAQVPPAEAIDAGALPTITVTATRTAQSTQDTAAAVTVISAASLHAAGPGLNLSEGLQGVPGLTALNRQNLAQDLQISSRGFGARSTFGVRGVRLYEDGIPLTMPDGQGQSGSFDLSQVQRLEVLRGPASALYGNASGGVIAAFTADGPPVPQVQMGHTLSRDGTQRSTLSAAGEREGLNYVFDVTQASTQGYRDHSAASRELWHAKLGWQLGARTRAQVIATQYSMPQADDPLGLTWAQVQSNPSQAGTNARSYNTRKNTEQGQLGGTITHELSDQDQLRLTSYSGHRSTTQWQSILTGTQAPAAYPGGVIDLDRQFAGVDLRHSHQGHWSDVPWRMNWGVSLDTMREFRQGFQNFDAQGQLGVTGALRRQELNRATDRSVYALSQWTLSPNWEASLGARMSRVRFTSHDQYIVPGNGDDSGQMDFSARTPTASLMWRVMPGWQTYVSLGRSFETPTLNEVAYRSNSGTATGWNTGLKAANATHREWGAKYQAARHYALSMALFQVNTSDEIAVQSNSGGRATYQNVGHTLRQGLELAQRWRATPSLQLETAVTWVRATYQDPFSSTSAGNTQVVPAGAKLPGVPARQLFAEALWQAPGAPWLAGLSWRHTGGIWVNDANTAKAPANGQWAVRTHWQHPLGAWRLDAFARVDNLLNKRAIGSVIVNESQGRYYEPSPGRTATVGMNLTRTFE